MCAAMLPLVTAGAGACGQFGATEIGGDLERSGEPATTTACPVTIPGPGLAPPDPYPAAPSDPASAWYGTPALWTMLRRDGSYGVRKSVWWSRDFQGGAAESTPAISVTWRRLDPSGEVIVEEGPGTNAFTVEDGQFMIAGIDPEEPGCWEVTASYRGTSLSYTYLLR